MTRFKKGDKVVMSDRFYDGLQLDPDRKKPQWLEIFEKKVLEDGYVVLSGIRDDREGVYFFSDDGVEVEMVLFDDWLEPYEITTVEFSRYFNLFVVTSLSINARMLAEAPIGPDIQPGDLVEIGEGRGNMYKVELKCGMDRESDYYKCVKSLERCKEFEKITRYYKMHEVREVQDGKVQDR